MFSKRVKTPSPPARTKEKATFEVVVSRKAGEPFGCLLKDIPTKLTVDGAGVQLAFVGPGALQDALLRLNDVIVSINGQLLTEGHERASEMLAVCQGDFTLVVHRPPPPASMSSRMLGVLSRRSPEAHSKTVGALPTAEGAGALPTADGLDREATAALLIQAHARGHAVRSSPDAQPAPMSWLERCLKPCLSCVAAPPAAPALSA